MNGQQSQGRRETPRFVEPIAEKRGRQNEESRRRGRTLGAPMEQHSQNLDGFSQTHVVRKACAKAKPGEEAQPMDTRTLVRAEARMQAGRRMVPARLRRAQFGQSFFQPIARAHIRPRGQRVRILRILSHAAQEPQPLGKRNAFFAMGFLESFPMVEDPLKLVAVHLSPPSANLYQALLAPQNLLPFLFAECLAVERERHLKIEHRAESKALRFSRTYGDADRRTGQPLPPSRHAHEQTTFLEDRNFAQEPVRFARCPALRVIDPLGIDKFANQRALFRRALHGSEQREQRRAVLGARVFLQRAAQREILRLGLVRNPVRVGGQKSKRTFRIALILGQVEGHPADEVPKGIARLEPGRSAARTGTHFSKNQRVERLPKALQRANAQVFRARHGRSGLRQLGKLLVRRRCEGFLPSRHPACGKAA